MPDVYTKTDENHHTNRNGYPHPHTDTDRGVDTHADTVTALVTGRRFGVSD